MVKAVRKYFYFLILGLFFLLAFVLRTKLYFQNNVFSDDECRLALCLMNKTMLQSLFFLGDAQSAPPVFVFVSKLITNIFGFAEAAAKFIPYISGLGAVYFFYKSCTSYFRYKLPVAAGLFLFAICQPLIAFSSIFKQYSTDVFAAALCLYFFPKINVTEMSKKQFICFSVIICILPFISLPSLVFIGALLVWNCKTVRILKFLLPFVVIMTLYFLFNLAPAKADLNKYFPGYWQDGFLAFSIKDFIRLIVFNIKFYFVPNKFSLPTLVLMFWGIYLYIRENSRNSVFILTAFVLVMLAAIFQLYPLSGRIGLYFIPVVLLLILKPLDIKNNGAVLVALFFLLFSFCKYDLSYFKNICDVDYFVSCSPKHLMQIMKEKFNPDTDIILCNAATTPSYLFYSTKFGLDTDKIYEMPIVASDKNFAMKYFSDLSGAQRIWLYLVKDYNNSRVYPLVFEWLDGKNIIYSYQERNSYLFYLEN